MFIIHAHFVLTWLVFHRACRIDESVDQKNATRRTY